METNRCPSCGALLENNGKNEITCSYCGTIIRLNNNSQNKNNNSKKKSRSKLVIGIVLGILIVAVTTIYVYLAKPVEDTEEKNDDIAQGIPSLEPATTNTIFDLANLQIGDSLLFGNYEQDNNGDNGEEKIEWIIVRRNEDGCLLMSKYALDHVAYNNTFDFVNWEDSSVRKWLNEYFYNHSFSNEEKLYIEEIENDIEYASKGSVKDNVFLLSVSEASEYFNEDEDRKCLATDYAITRGVQAYGDRTCWWWLRSVCEDNEYAMNVRSQGNLRYGPDCKVNDEGYGARPTIFVKYEKASKNSNKKDDAKVNKSTPKVLFTIEVLDEKIGVYDSYEDSRNWVDAIYRGEVYNCEQTYYDGTYLWYKIGENRWIKDLDGSRVKTLGNDNNISDVEEGIIDNGKTRYKIENETLTIYSGKANDIDGINYNGQINELLQSNKIKDLLVKRGADLTYACIWDIDTVIVEDGVENIGRFAFEDVIMKKIFLPKTLKTIEGTFCSPDCTVEAYYSGTEEEWNNLLASSGINPTSSIKSGFLSNVTCNYKY